MFFFFSTEENAKKIGMLGALPVMLKMLSNKDLGDEDKTQIILTLAHAADIYGMVECHERFCMILISFAYIRV